jgi:hypothetical protein
MFVDRAISSTSLSYGTVRVKMSSMIYVVKQQPQLESRVRQRDGDVFAFCKGNRLRQVRMLFWPFNVEDAPVFIGGVSALCSNCLLDERQGHSAGQIDSQIDAGCAANLGQLCQGSKVLRFGRSAFAK